MTCAWCASTFLISPFSSSSRMAARAKDPLTFRRSTNPDAVMSFICWIFNVLQSKAKNGETNVSEGEKNGRQQLNKERFKDKACPYQVMLSMRACGAWCGDSFSERCLKRAGSWKLEGKVTSVHHTKRERCVPSLQRKGTVSGAMMRHTHTPHNT